MKLANFKMFLFLAMALSNKSYSQDVVYSAIFKNINKTAENLKHDLNLSGDTLYLKSKFDLNRIEVMGVSGLKDYEINNSTKEIRIPLHVLPMGDYTFAVVQTEGRDDTYIYTKTIIFKISRLLPIDLNLSKSMHLLQSSTNIAYGHIPILDLKENKIITDFKNPIGLSNNEETQLVSIDSKSQTEFMKNKDFTSLSLIKDGRVKEEKQLRIKNTEELFEGNKPVYVKKYNLSDTRYANHNMQSRAEYRRNNLRPNGKPYD